MGRVFREVPPQVHGAEGGGSAGGSLLTAPPGPAGLSGEVPPQVGGGGMAGPRGDGRNQQGGPPRSPRGEAGELGLLTARTHPHPLRFRVRGASAQSASSRGEGAIVGRSVPSSTRSGPEEAHCHITTLFSRGATSVTTWPDTQNQETWPSETASSIQFSPEMARY